MDVANTTIIYCSNWSSTETIMVVLLACITIPVKPPVCRNGSRVSVLIIVNIAHFTSTCLLAFQVRPVSFYFAVESHDCLIFTKNNTEARAIQSVTEILSHSCALYTWILNFAVQGTAGSTLFGRCRLSVCNDLVQVNMSCSPSSTGCQ